MVTNKNNMLDEGQIKYVPDVNMKPKYIREFENKLAEARKIQDRYEWAFKEGSVTFSNRNDYENSPLHELKMEYEKIREDPMIMEHINFPGGDKFFAKGCKKIASYMGVIPFLPCVMINISPNWKGKFGKDTLLNDLMMKHFIKVIEKYLGASNRYERYKYVIECGGDGDHLHAHIVAEMKEGTQKSVVTHLNKGNHAVELRKIWDKEFPKGYEGYLKGKYAVQRILLRTETLRDDKLDYLVEELKPEGHKNLKDLGSLRSRGF